MIENPCLRPACLSDVFTQEMDEWYRPYWNPKSQTVCDVHPLYDLYRAEWAKRGFERSPFPSIPELRGEWVRKDLGKEGKERGFNMPTREAVAAFIYRQLHDGDTKAIPDKRLKNRDPGDGTKEPHHYGACELRHLMDFLYGGPPTKPSEEIKACNHPYWINYD